MRGTFAVLLGLLLTATAFAQQSPSYLLEEHTFNAGGHPADGVVLTSVSYSISLDAIGDAVGARTIGSESFQLDGSFVAAYPPPGEVLVLQFGDEVTLIWTPERSAGTYNLYRDLMSNLVSETYGACSQQGLSTTTTTDTDQVPEEDGYFYLVTVENRLGEEGIKGLDSSDTLREGNVCP